MIDNFIDYLEENFDVSRVAGGRQLKVGGQCPFCNEDRHDLRLYINPKTGMGFCHHCGTPFGPQKFVMVHAGVSWADAEKMLADKDKFRKFDEEDEAPTESSVWWPNYCFIAEVPEAYDYLASRGFNGDLIDTFQLFYCHTDTLVGEKIYRTKDRILIPIKGGSGEFECWQGRDITGKAYIKYMSSPGVKLGEYIYNLAAVQSNPKYAILCEGVFDVFGWWRAGFENAVATFGKKISDIQVGMLAALNIGIVFVAWDSDADWKKWEFMEQHGHRFNKVRFVDLKGWDADEVNRGYLFEAISRAKPYSWADKIMGALS